MSPAARSASAATIWTRLAEHGVDAQGAVGSTIGAVLGPADAIEDQPLVTTAGRLGAALERWSRIGMLETSLAPAEEWVLVDACIVTDQRTVHGGTWYWTFVWSHVPTGMAAAVAFLSCGRGLPPDSTASSDGPRGGAFPGMGVVVDSTLPGMAPRVAVAHLVAHSASKWRFAETLEELAATRSPGGHVAALGVASSPVIVTPGVRVLAQLRVPSSVKEPALFLDAVGSVPVREQPWIPEDIARA